MSSGIKASSTRLVVPAKGNSTSEVAASSSLLLNRTGSAEVPKQPKSPMATQLASGLTNGFTHIDDVTTTTGQPIVTKTSDGGTVTTTTSTRKVVRRSSDIKVGEGGKRRVIVKKTTSEVKTGEDGGTADNAPVKRRVKRTSDAGEDNSTTDNAPVRRRVKRPSDANAGEDDGTTDNAPVRRRVKRPSDANTGEDDGTTDNAPADNAPVRRRRVKRPSDAGEDDGTTDNAPVRHRVKRPSDTGEDDGTTDNRRRRVKRPSDANTGEDDGNAPVRRRRVKRPSDADTGEGDSTTDNAPVRRRRVKRPSDADTGEGDGTTDNAPVRRRRVKKPSDTDTGKGDGTTDKTPVKPSDTGEDNATVSTDVKHHSDVNSEENATADKAAEVENTSEKQTDENDPPITSDNNTTITNIDDEIERKNKRNRGAKVTTTVIAMTTISSGESEIADSDIEDELINQIDDEDGIPKGYSFAKAIAEKIPLSSEVAAVYAAQYEGSGSVTLISSITDIEKGLDAFLLLGSKPDGTLVASQAEDIHGSYENITRGKVGGFRSSQRTKREWMNVQKVILVLNKRGECT